MKHTNKNILKWLAAVAAVLVIALLVSLLLPPATASAQGLIAAPEYPEMAPYPDESKYYESNDWDSFDKEYDAITCQINECNFIGRAAKLEVTL